MSTTAADPTLSVRSGPPGPALPAGTSAGTGRRARAARTATVARSVERIWRPGEPVPVHQILASLRRGGSDPCFRARPGAPLWRATRTPDGAALLRLIDRPGSGEVEATAWGPGAGWVLEGVPELLGALDDPSGFEPRPEHPRLVAAWRAHPGYRVPRSRAVFEALVPATLEQRVTGQEAWRAWAHPAVLYGEPAPGPASDAAGMYVPPDPATWPPGAGAVDPGRLERLDRQRLEAGEQDQEHQRRPLPDVEATRPTNALRVAEDLHGRAAHASDNAVSMPTSLA